MNSKENFWKVMGMRGTEGPVRRRKSAAVQQASEELHTSEEVSPS
jgi:hypothetical protein